MQTRIGIVSDTHGLLRSEVIKALKGVDIILHAGDIVGEGIIDQLQKIAPVYAVRGNCDSGAWGMQFPKTDVIEVGKLTMYLLHNLYELDIAPGAAGVNVIISGHTHIPAFEEKGGILYLNPGSCGPRRFQLPIAMAIMELDGERVQVHLLNLESHKKSRTFQTTISS